MAESLPDPDELGRKLEDVLNETDATSDPIYGEDEGDVIDTHLPFPLQRKGKEQKHE